MTFVEILRSAAQAIATFAEGIGVLIVAVAVVLATTRYALVWSGERGRSHRKACVWGSADRSRWRSSSCSAPTSGCGLLRDPSPSGAVSRNFSLATVSGFTKPTPAGPPSGVAGRGSGVHGSSTEGRPYAARSPSCAQAAPSSPHLAPVASLLARRISIHLTERGLFDVARVVLGIRL